MSFSRLRAGLLQLPSPATPCHHCSKPRQGGADLCRCGAAVHDWRGPGHGVGGIPLHPISSPARA